MGGSSCSRPAACSLRSPPRSPTRRSPPAKRGLLTGFADTAGSRPATRPNVPPGWTGRSRRGPGSCASMSLGRASRDLQRPTDPTNPGSASYDFSTIDAAVRDAEARGLAVLLHVYGAPAWAEAPGRPPSAAAGHLEAEPLRPRRLHAGGRGALLGWLRPRWPRPGAAAPCRAGAAGLERAQPPGVPDAAIRGRDRRQPRPLPGDAERRLLGREGGRPADARGHRRHRPVWRSPRWQSRPTRAVLATGCSACTQTKKKKKKKKKGASKPVFVRAQNCPAPARFDVLAHHPINTSGGPAARPPSTRTTPPARTSIGSCACCAAPRPLGRCCRDGTRSGRTRSGGTAIRRIPPASPSASRPVGSRRRSTCSGRTARAW